MVLQLDYFYCLNLTICHFILTIIHNYPQKYSLWEFSRYPLVLGRKLT